MMYVKGRMFHIGCAMFQFLSVRNTADFCWLFYTYDLGAVGVMAA
jgi:hypothetical protein